MKAPSSFCYSFLILAFFCFRKTLGIHCYQCNSSKTMICGESLAEGHALLPEDCSHLQEPRFCVKMTGIFEVAGLMCYQCDSNVDLFCPETLRGKLIPENHSMVLKSCDHVFDAQYCIKTIGMFAGELGTKRFCSARDFGNYCEWLRRPGDEREYRGCVFTCTTHGCNSTPPSGIKTSFLMLATVCSLWLAGRTILKS